jgi:hypothetical protein
LTICQSTKPNTTKGKPPLYPITTDHAALPFEHISVDLIVKLPQSQGYDSILTVTDHNCSKVAFFIPCNEAMDAEGMAHLYRQHVFPHYGIPKSIISDRDPHFASAFTRELCKILGICQNISTAYHPQTDGQSKGTNQWLEQYLHICTNHCQTDWVQWLPITQYVHNVWPSTTTKKAPYGLIMGHTLHAHLLWYHTCFLDWAHFVHL